MKILQTTKGDIAVVDGMYSATDLLKLVGSAKKYQPNYFMRAKGTTSFIDALSAAGETQSYRKSVGRYGGGTYMSKMLFIKYAAWISPDIEVQIMASLINKSEVCVFDIARSIDIDVEHNTERFVYVVKESVSGRYKIGISKDPERRMKELNTGNPEELVMVACYRATHDGYKSENLAHREFEQARLRSEWFDSNTDVARLNNLM